MDETMAESTFTFRVDDELKTAFSEAAKAQDRTSAQLLRVLMREAVETDQSAREYDAWFNAEIDQALKEADDPNAVWIPHEEVMARMEAKIAQLKRRLSDEAA
jgi:predicted transcriptional regulator